MFIKFKLTANDTTINLPNYCNNMSNLRIHSLAYKSGVANTSRDLKMFINGFNDKYDLDNEDRYFFYMPLSSYASTMNIYNIPISKNDFTQEGNSRRLSQLNISVLIDGLKTNVDNTQFIMIELEII